MIKKTVSRRIFEFLNTLFLVFLMIVAVYPVIHIIMASFSDPVKFMAHTGLMFRPAGDPTLLAYQNALKHPQIMGAYGNTLFIVVVGVAINIVLTSIGAYFLSRKEVLFQRPIAVLIIVTMFFSGGMIPFYFTVKDLGLYNSIWSLILPVSVNTFNLMVMKTGFSSIPDIIEESARLDGAGHFTILFKFVLPLSLPIVAVMVLYYGVAHWNSWFNALLFINKPEKYPLQLVLRQILLANETSSMTMGVDAGAELAVSETIKYAVIVISTMPILCVYPFLQKYFVKGIMVGAVKG
ncbi:MAG: carbohydrate ABC transporter permease [Clostridia bacterium]|nr:carbohydrate ABC transporter permease [Clostridia bacterium]